MTIKTSNEKQVLGEANPRSPADYMDIDFNEVQKVTDYITKNSVPVNMTIFEVQGVINAYSILLTKALNNLNLLRELAGEDPVLIPTMGEK